jgi:hypothetical protein
MKWQKKIKSYPDESLNWDDPKSFKFVLKIICKDGREFVEKVNIVRGYPEKFVTADDVIDKLNDCSIYARKKIQMNQSTT